MTKPRRRKTSRSRRKAPVVETLPQFVVKLSAPEPILTVGQVWNEMVPYVITYPSDWWQAFKDRWFPAWLKARFPVQYTEHRYSAPLKTATPNPATVNRGQLVAVTPQGTATTAANSETSVVGISLGAAPIGTDTPVRV